jgi:hypothetical protein
MIQKFIDKCWTSHLWEFNDRYGLTVKQEDKAWLLPQCKHDQFNMEALTTFQQPPQKDCEEHNAAIFSFKLQH